MYKLRIVQSGKEYDYEPGASLLEILLAQNIFIDNPCNGKGVCGKCKVRIVSGEVGEVSSTELRFLKPEEVKSGVRLSCMVHPQCDLEVELMQKERKHEVLSKGYVPKFEKDLDIVKQVVNIHKPLLTELHACVLSASALLPDHTVDEPYKKDAHHFLLLLVLRNVIL